MTDEGPDDYDDLAPHSEDPVDSEECRDRYQRIERATVYGRALLAALSEGDAEAARVIVRELDGLLDTERRAFGCLNCDHVTVDVRVRGPALSRMAVGCPRCGAPMEER